MPFEHLSLTMIGELCACTTRLAAECAPRLKTLKTKSIYTQQCLCSPGVKLQLLLPSCRLKTPSQAHKVTQMIRTFLENVFNSFLIAVCTNVSSLLKIYPLHLQTISNSLFSRSTYTMKWNVWITHIGRIEDMVVLRYMSLQIPISFPAEQLLLFHTHSRY